MVSASRMMPANHITPSARAQLHQRPVRIDIRDHTVEQVAVLVLLRLAVADQHFQVVVLRIIILSSRSTMKENVFIN